MIFYFLFKINLSVNFSLLGHLDLDLELDDDLLLQPTARESNAYTPTFEPIQPPTTSIRTIATDFDPRQPLFFPLTPSIGEFSTKGQKKDIYDVVRMSGWSWRDPAAGFWRTESEEEIRTRWKEVKVELTRDWKRRWREARKMRKRRGGSYLD
jgi:hypothetical protein